MSKKYNWYVDGKCLIRYYGDDRYVTVPGGIEEINGRWYSDQVEIIRLTLPPSL